MAIIDSITKSIKSGLGLCVEGFKVYFYFLIFDLIGVDLIGIDLIGVDLIGVEEMRFFGQ